MSKYLHAAATKRCFKELICNYWSTLATCCKNANLQKLSTRHTIWTEHGCYLLLTCYCFCHVADSACTHWNHIANVTYDYSGNGAHNGWQESKGTSVNVEFSPGLRNSTLQLCRVCVTQVEFSSQICCGHANLQNLYFSSNDFAHAQIDTMHRHNKHWSVWMRPQQMQQQNHTITHPGPKPRQHHNELCQQEPQMFGSLKHNASDAFLMIT